jgi:acyl-ACP thioesterase
MVTFCAGLGRTWAQRRVTVTGELGARYDVATLWVSIEPDSMRPRRLSRQFLDIYGPAAQGRKVSAKQRIPRPSTEAVARSSPLEWTPRWGDFDAFGHMNNVVYWSAVQHAFGTEVPAGARITVEHGSGVQPGDPSLVLVDRGVAGTALRMWWLTDGGDGPTDASYSAAAEVRVG